MNQRNIPKSEESIICLSCGECCKRYWITVLPTEAQKISRMIGKSKKEFLENDCVLNVKLYPKSTPGMLTFPTFLLPERILDLIKKELDLVPQSFFVVPQVVLRREEKSMFDFREKMTKMETRRACVFLNPENACVIYSARPKPCELFPFIVMPGFSENYPFCLLFQKTRRDYAIESKIYYKKIKDYFKSVNDKGFSYIWISPPKKGILFLQEKEIGEISLTELNEIMKK